MQKSFSTIILYSSEEKRKDQCYNSTNHHLSNMDNPDRLISSFYLTSVVKPIYRSNASVYVRACVCALIAALLCCHRESMCTAAAAKKRASQTRADAKWQLCISLTGTDSWQMDSTHTPQEKKTGREQGRVRRGGMEREEERERVREKAPRMIRQHCSLFRGPAFDWVLQRIINPPLAGAVPSFLSLPYLSLSPLFLSNPSPPLILSFSPNPFIVAPPLALCFCSFMLRLLFPRPVFNTSWSIFMFFSLYSLCSPFHSSAICLHLPSRCICLSLSEVRETGVRGPCQTNQQYSLTDIPLCIWLCIWICAALYVSTTTDTGNVHEQTHTHRATFTTAEEHVMDII